MATVHSLIQVPFKKFPFLCLLKSPRALWGGLKTPHLALDRKSAPFSKELKFSSRLDD